MFQTTNQFLCLPICGEELRKVHKISLGVERNQASCWTLLDIANAASTKFDREANLPFGNASSTEDFGSLLIATT